MLVMEAVKSGQVLDMCQGTSQEYFLVYCMSGVNVLPRLKFSKLTSHTHPLFLSFSGNCCLEKSRGLGVVSETNTHGVIGKLLHFPDGLFLGSQNPEMERERKRVYS